MTRLAGGANAAGQSLPAPVVEEIEIMTKFRILIEGHHVMLRVNGGIVRCGFFTTRHIQANNEAEASGKAKEIVQKELGKTCASTQGCVLDINLIEAIESFDGLKVPGKGFTFYPEEADR